jgi:hypothetical protein
MENNLVDDLLSTHVIQGSDSFAQAIAGASMALEALIDKIIAWRRDG